MQEAIGILTAGAQHMQDRAEHYDSPEGEHSVPKAVDMLNILTGSALSYEQGWLFMAMLKMVRSQQGGFKLDNYEDMAAYCALAGEQGQRDAPPRLVDAS